jgi:hypothetical protein
MLITAVRQRHVLPGTYVPNLTRTTTREFRFSHAWWNEWNAKFAQVADTFPTTCLVVSGAQGRNLSLVSPQVVSLVAQYPELKIVTAGVRLFERCSTMLISVPPSDTQVIRSSPEMV